MRSIVHRTALAAGLTLAAACADAPTGLDLDPDLARNGKNGGNGRGGAGTTLTATKTATGFNEHRTEYDWTLEKQLVAILDEHMIPEPSTTETSLAPRTIKWLDYRITATRSEPMVTSVAGVRGEVCVRNAGERPTEGLAIRDVVQRKVSGGWVDHASADVDVSARPVLAPGETHCYPYEILFTPNGADYRNTALVTITNHSGSLGVPSGPAFNGGGIKAEFSLPATPTTVTHDAEAFIYDPNPTNVPGSYERGGCAALWPLFFCTAAGNIEGWFLTESATFDYMVDVGNLYACGDTYEMTNTAVLTESGAGDYAPGSDRHFRTVSFDIQTPDCLPATGAVRDVEHWSRDTDWPPHQFWGRTFRIQDFPFFDTGETWLEALQGRPRTTYDRLSQEYIATTLNFMSGAPVPRPVQDVRSAVGHYFGSWPEDRAQVSEAQLAEWADVLESYNTGG